MSIIVFGKSYVNQCSLNSQKYFVRQFKQGGAGCVAKFQRKNICHNSYLSWMESLPEVTMVSRAHFFKLICEKSPYIDISFFQAHLWGNLDIIHFHSTLALHSLVSYPLQALMGKHQYLSSSTLFSSSLSSLE